MTQPPRLRAYLLVMLVTLVASLACAPGIARARTMQQKLQDACAADIQALCPQAASDADALKACMLNKRSQVSAACMRMIDASE